MPTTPFHIVLALSLSFAHASVALCLSVCTVGWWELSAISTTGETLADLRDAPRQAELLPLLPEGSYLLVGNCEVPRFVDPRFSVGGDPSPVIIRASASS
jgi:hypothetical protein